MNWSPIFNSVRTKSVKEAAFFVWARPAWLIVGLGCFFLCDWAAAPVRRRRFEKRKAMAPCRRCQEGRIGSRRPGTKFLKNCVFLGMRRSAGQTVEGERLLTQSFFGPFSDRDQPAFCSKGLSTLIERANQSMSPQVAPSAAPSSECARSGTTLSMRQNLRDLSGFD